MKKRNLSAKTKIHNFFIDNLKNSKIKKIFLEFNNCLENYSSSRVCIALSGGPDSMALVFLAKTYSIKKNITFFYYIVNHNLRKESSKEANLVKKFLKKYNINCKILTWNRNQTFTNIQETARNKRYQLIFNECKKKKINLITTAHQRDDLYENFFIRMLRGSGLKGLSSFIKVKTKISKKENIYILRPLLNFSKKDLEYVTTKTFNFYLKDPSNNDDNFLRVKTRKLLNFLYREGLNFNKFKMTLENLYKSNISIEHYVTQNIKKNAKLLSSKKAYITNEDFYNNSEEVVFRSLSELIHKIGNKKNYSRGSKISNLIKNIKSNKKLKKMTLSGCLIEKINKSIIISEEN